MKTQCLLLSLMLGLASCDDPTLTLQPAPPAEPLLPNPSPVFESQGFARQDPVFQVEDFAYHAPGSHEGTLHELPSFAVGNKAVFVRKIDGRNRPDQDSSVTVVIDGKEVGRFMWWGSFKSDTPKNFGYPFKDISGDPARLHIDKEAQIVTYEKPYLTPGGKRAVFFYTLRSLQDSKVEISWDLGVTQQELEASQNDFGVSLWFLTKDYRGKKLLFGGEEFREASREDLLSGKVTTSASGAFVYDAGAPSEGYVIDFGDLKGSIEETVMVPQLGDDRYSLMYRTAAHQRRVKDRIVIDFGEAPLPQTDTPPAVGGIDFWKFDATHVPLSPVRNVMPNPSFEQGLRYWTWCAGGATYTPGEPPRYATVPEGKFGKNALILRDTQPGAPGMISFPMSLEKDQTYTLSFYARAARDCKLTVSLASAARGGKFVGKNGPFGDTWNPESQFKITTEWKRYTRTFIADSAGLSLGVFGSRDTLIDGIQIEKGDRATDFVSAPLDGVLTTADPDNALLKGAPIDAEFMVTGKPGTTGEVALTAKNAYRETVYSETFPVTVGEDGVQILPLAFDAEKFGEGVFVVGVEYTVDGFAPYVDYDRLSIMTPLTNTHATKNIFGTIGSYDRISRGEELAQKYMDWGFGSTSWGYSNGDAKLRPELEKNYRIANIGTMIITQDKEIGKHYREWESISPEMEKRIEEVAYESAKLRDPEQYNIWAFGNEEESSSLPGSGRFDEYFKAQFATAKGVRRAMPDAKILPTCGTSGYSLLRGYDAMEGYLKAAQDHDFKYDGIAVHPYGSIDKGTLSGTDLDEETARLIAQMKRYGYGKETPIYYTEMFNITETYVPTWNADRAYDYYGAGKPTYDFGNREFIHAASAARAYIIALKYWPQLQSVNIWVSRPFMDMNLAPLILCKAVNTLGTHLPWVEYQADIRPTGDIRGYAFKLEDGSGIAPIWCIDSDVENGLKRGPTIEVRFGQPVEFYDLMGNRRAAEVDADGVTRIPLTPAPLLIKADNVDLLAKALQNAETNDSSSALTVAMSPTLEGAVLADIKNLTGREQSGDITVSGKTLPYDLKPEGRIEIPLADSNQGNNTGRMFRWEADYKVEPAKGEGFASEWKMDYFYVPKTEGMPDWNRIPSIPITNRYVSSYTVRQPGQAHGLATPEAGYPGDFKAQYQMAWNKDHLYLRVEVEDDRFLAFPELWKKAGSEQQLWAHDGALEVYFDTGANGRTNKAKTYDNDDYRYDFSVGKDGKSGPGMVYRLREVYHQLADGVNMATKEEAAEKITCDFQRTAKGYTYTITFGQRYIEPIVLRKGFMAGFGLFLHDRDDAAVPSGVKGLSLATEAGSHCDYKPHLWPLMILSE